MADGDRRTDVPLQLSTASRSACSTSTCAAAINVVILISGAVSVVALSGIPLVGSDREELAAAGLDGFWDTLDPEVRLTGDLWGVVTTA